jgi:hypothetical protein
LLCKNKLGQRGLFQVKAKLSAIGLVPVDGTIDWLTRVCRDKRFSAGLAPVERTTLGSPRRAAPNQGNPPPSHFVPYEWTKSAAATKRA